MLRRFLKISLKTFLIAYVVFKAGLIAAFGWFWLATPDPSVLKTANPQTTSFIQNRCSASREPGCALSWTPLAQMSPFIPQAVVLAEDIRFFRHGGLDFQSLWAALKINLKSGRIRWGGSTLTQQLAKNLYLGSEKTVGRKMRELALTFKLERKLPKERILELYLNVAQWGPNLFGIGNASQHFFGKPPSELGPLEASYLASILPNPEHADEPAWQEKFRDVGARLFDALLQSYLPPLRVPPESAASCPDALDASEAGRADYVVAKIFSSFSGGILSGRAALLSSAELKSALTEDENGFIESLWQRARAVRNPPEVSCKRDDQPAETGFAVTLQPSFLYGQRSYYIPSSAEKSAAALMAAAKDAGVPLMISSAYRGGGYQTYLFLATLRQNGYCLSRTAREVAQLKESEHACLDTPAIDFGSLNEEGIPFEKSKAFAWMTAHAGEFGFTLSYPENNAQGVLYEPWHWKWSGKN